MRRFRSLKCEVAVAIGSGFGLPACDTGAVGVDSCRNIEYARCEAAAQCPDMFALKSVDACKRFYRDHCLHGLPLGSDPGPGIVNPCVTAINALGSCASQNEGTLGAQCDQRYKQPYTGTDTVCELIQNPQDIPACSFLVSSSSADASVSAGGAAGTGGAAGSGGASAASGGVATGGASTAATSDATGGSATVL